MSTVSEIESAIQKLSRSDLTTFRDWFHGFDAAAWDAQLEEDVASGRLDRLADEAISDLREGRSTILTATNQALAQTKEISNAEMGKVTAGMNMPGFG